MTSDFDDNSHNDYYNELGKIEKPDGMVINIQNKIFGSIDPFTETTVNVKFKDKKIIFKYSYLGNEITIYDLIGESMALKNISFQDVNYIFKSSFGFDRDQIEYWYSK